MAYQTRTQQNSVPARNNNAAPAAKSARKTLYKTGLFAPNKEGVKSLGSVQVKEDIHIPAGSYINLYENDKRTSDKSPVFSVAITEGSLGKKQA